MESVRLAVLVGADAYTPDAGPTTARHRGKGARDTWGTDTLVTGTWVTED